jgi:predicted RNase H-like HicB family nuclease
LRYTRGVKTLADYTVVVRPDDGTWMAYVPAIPGCHAMGDSPEDARRELDGVFKMFAEDYSESGESMPPDVKELVPVAS